MVTINKPYDDCIAVLIMWWELTQALFGLKMCSCSVPKQLRDAMESAGWSIGRSPTHHIVTSIDGTVKVLLKPLHSLFNVFPIFLRKRLCNVCAYMSHSFDLVFYFP